MNIESYTTELVGETEFKFFSEGKNGRFEMRIRFERIGADLFNLAFGSTADDLSTIDDGRELRNGDMDMILATVASKAVEFLDFHPKASIYATGLVLPGKLAIRTRKYQIEINKNLSYLSERHNIYGFKEFSENNLMPVSNRPFQRSGRWEAFKPNTNYDAFLLNLK